MACVRNCSDGDRLQESNKVALVIRETYAADGRVWNCASCLALFGIEA